MADSYEDDLRYIQFPYFDFQCLSLPTHNPILRRIKIYWSLISQTSFLLKRINKSEANVMGIETSDFQRLRRQMMCKWALKILLHYYLILMYIPLSTITCCRDLPNSSFLMLFESWFYKYGKILSDLNSEMIIRT